MPTQLDYQQVIQNVYDEPANRLRVDAAVGSISIIGTVEVEIDAASGDNIALSNSDGSKQVTVTTLPGSVEALDVNVANEVDVNVLNDINIAISAADGDDIAISAHVNQIFDENADSITTAGFEEIFTYTSINDDTFIMGIDSTVATPTHFRVKVDGDIKRELRSSSLERNVKFQFGENRPLASGSVISVEAQVERFITGVGPYSTFTSMEGYIR